MPKKKQKTEREGASDEQQQSEMQSDSGEPSTRDPMPTGEEEPPPSSLPESEDEPPEELRRSSRAARTRTTYASGGRGTATVSVPDPDAFTLRQYPGKTLGTAGDAAVLRLGPSTLVIDFGNSLQAEMVCGELRGGDVFDAVITHFHDDHAGPAGNKFAKALWAKARHVFVAPTAWSEGALARHAAALTRSGNGRSASIARTHEVIWNPTHKALSVRLVFIAPDIPRMREGIEPPDEGESWADPQQENAHSGGVYGEVLLGGAVVFRWASLGDMVPTAEPDVLAVLGSDTRGEPRGKLHLLKMPHHGSENNHMHGVFERHVDESTTLVSSGYNSPDPEWLKMRDSTAVEKDGMWTSSLKKDQVRIITSLDGIPMAWQPHVQRLFVKTVNQAGEVK